MFCQYEEKLRISCSDCHFYWNFPALRENLSVELCEKKLVNEVKNEPVEAVAAFTLIAYLYYQENNLEQAFALSKKALRILDIPFENSEDADIRGHENARRVKDNGRKYIALSVYLHILYKIKQFKCFDECYDTLSGLAVTPHSRCQIQLIKGYAFKNICKPSQTEILDVFLQAQKFNPHDSEAIFQEAIVRRNIRRDSDRFISKPCNDEINALEKVKELWKEKPEYKGYPETLLMTARLGGHLFSLLENEKRDNISQLKDRFASEQKRQENSQHIEDYILQIRQMYPKFKQHYRYINRAYREVIAAVKELTLLSLTSSEHEQILNMQKYIIAAALKQHPRDFTLAYHAGVFYCKLWKRTNSEQAKKSAKLHLEQCKNSPGGNPWADVYLLRFRNNDDVVIASEELLEKYKDIHDKEKSVLYSKTAFELEKFNKGSAAIFILLEAIRLDPKNQKAKQNIIRLLKIEEDDISQWYTLAEVYILSGLDSEENYKNAYENVMNVYSESKKFQSISTYYCKVRLHKAKIEMDVVALNDILASVTEVKDETEQHALLMQLHLEIANLCPKTEELSHLVLACCYGSIDGGLKALDIMEGKAVDDIMYFASEEPFKFCAIIYQYLNKQSDIRECWTGKSVDEIRKRIYSILNLSNSNNSKNADLYHFRKKRHNMCISYEQMIGYSISGKSQPENELSAELEETFQLEAELVLQYTRILLDRAFKAFHTGNYKNSGVRDVYYPILHDVPDETEAMELMMTKLEEYGMEGFDSKFPELLHFLATHQKHKQGMETVNSFLVPFIKFSNLSKHERSIISFLKDIKKQVGINDSSLALLSFVHKACTYTEEVVAELSRAKPSQTANLEASSTRPVADEKSILIVGDALMQNIQKHWRNKRFIVRKVVLSSEKPTIESLRSVKEGIEDFDYVIFQIGIIEVLKDNTSNSNTFTWQLVSQLDNFQKDSNVKLVVGGVPHIKDNAVIANVNQILQRNCNFIQDVCFVSNDNFKDGHIHCSSDKYALTDKGDTLWERNITNALRKL